MQLKRTNVSRRGALRILSVAGAQLLLTQPAMADTNTDLAKAQGQLADAEAQLGAIATDYEELSRKQSVTLDELDAVETRIEEISVSIAAIEERLAAKRDKLSKNVAEEYKDGNHGVVDLLVGSTSIEDFISGLYYYEKVTDEQARLIRDVEEEHERLEQQRSELAAQRENLKEISKAQSEQLEAMRDKQLEAQQLVDGLSGDVRKLLEQRESELFAAQQEAAQARKQRESAAAGNGTQAAPQDTATSAVGAATSSTTQAPTQAPTSSESTDSKRDAKPQETVPESKTPAQTEAEQKPTVAETQPETSTQPEASKQPVEGSAPEPKSEPEPKPEPEPEPQPQPEPEPQPQPEPEPPEPEPEPEPEGGSEGRGTNGSGTAAAVIEACQSTPSPGGGLCAAWCSNVMMNAGYGFIGGNANDMYAEYCYSSNRGDLQPGMAVAVSTHPHTSAGRIYGHIGMYIGDGMVMDNIGYIRTISLDEWIDYYGETVPVRWGWLGGIALD